MERRILQPEQIIVPGEYELGNESILKIYFRVFDRGHGGDLPPVIVTRSSVDISRFKPTIEYQRAEKKLDEYEQNGTFTHEDNLLAREHNKRCYERKMAEYSSILEKVAQLDKEGSRYILLDGNHKSTAATLSHQPIPSLELQTDTDVEEIRRMVERGELFDFKRNDTSLVELVGGFYEFCKDRLKDFNTLRERIDRLTANGDLPKYMKERYQRGK